MYTYKCSDCQSEFDEPKLCGEVFPAGVRDYHGCPNCESSDYEKVEVCCVCNEAFTDNSRFLKFNNGDTVCNDCLRDYCKEMFCDG